MKLGGYRESSNVEDRRGLGVRGIGGLGIGGTIIVAVIAMIMGVDPRTLLDQVNDATTDVSETRPTTNPDAPNDEGKRFVSRVLASTEDVWGKTLPGYREPRLVLFTDQVASACGIAGSATGPFYCPGDQRVYIDLGFYRELEQRFHAPGEFAQAYVIAHEIGHHVQNLTGVFERTRPQAGAEGTAVRTELQADCLAGVWASRAGSDYHLIEAGDIEQGLTAAAAIGDDRLQKQSRGHVVPDSFTHGTSAQRVRWFKKGVESGDPRTCDAFGAQEL